MISAYLNVSHVAVLNIKPRSALLSPRLITNIGVKSVRDYTTLEFRKRVRRLRRNERTRLVLDLVLISLLVGSIVLASLYARLIAEFAGWLIKALEIVG